MGEGVELEETARRRLRTLRQARGWTLDDLAARAHLGASTISRIETGQRRLAVDQLVTLARALDVTVDELLADDDGDDVVIRPTPSGDGGAVWMLTRHDDPSGRVVAKLRVPASTSAEPERRVHPGRDWFYVLTGTVRLVLGGREHVVAAGEAASFSTMTPHCVVGVGGPAEILTILDGHGERAHLDAP
ncbi:helix-turn-helix domain-containing protein [Quadrisphaera sp. DSM 44207]|uniref:helix-turn-helix domain-containing protein n=1 Tax=Quadrisphaera sp. DSM 44207 TaxID=1881057 RepID=UPI0008925F98|nr:XRE family transcriptional regulator [Quadrisphaera sp. DSM 44207]SDQ19164.1 transcriptional regulator, XRE family with cupin sensor [Quadrisphaera sp. DSM 44207]